MKILYFAWLKEKIGVSQEEVALADGVTDVAGLIQWLTTRGGGYGEAFANPDVVRVAVNQEHVAIDHVLADGDEVAFFPPVTGG